MALMRTPSLVTAIRFETTNSSNGRHPRNPDAPVPRLSVSKPSWIVRTESNVRIERRKKPDPPCVICRGSGRVECHDCCGKGRTNYLNLPMLPKGEWPKWCRSCGGSGLGYCSRCLGTGEYRYIMGFHFMKMDADSTQGRKKRLVSDIPGSQSAADLLLNDEQPSSNHER